MSGSSLPTHRAGRRAVPFPLLSVSPFLFGVVLLLGAALSGCARSEAGTGDAPGAIPLGTADASAREHFQVGERMLDAGRFREANEHFRAAVAADPEFAYGHLMVANSAGSLDEFKENLDRAAERLAGAPDGVRLQVEMAQRGLDGDLEGQLGLADQLAQTYPESPRAHTIRAGALQALNRHEDARAALRRAVELDSTFLAGWDGLRFSFQNQRDDLAQAEKHARQVVALAPEESNAHENLGDVLRARGRLEEAGTAYRRAAELDPEDGVPPLKEGHIHSFLGHYDMARAAYDRAIPLAREAERVSFPVYRAFTRVHAGEGAAAVREIRRIVDGVDGLDLAADRARGAKLFALQNLVMVAAHHGDFAAAERALAERSPLQVEQAELVGTEEFRTGQRVGTTYLAGLIAVRKGDLSAASNRVRECMEAANRPGNPRAAEPCHALMGLVSLAQGSAREAIAHLEQADTNDIYVKYNLALAHEAAGDADRARALMGEVASFNFNSVEFALLRADAVRRAGGGSGQTRP